MVVIIVVVSGLLQQLQLEKLATLEADGRFTGLQHVP